MKNYIDDQLTINMLTTVVSLEETLKLFKGKNLTYSDWHYIGAAPFMDHDKYFDLYLNRNYPTINNYVLIWYNGNNKSHKCIRIIRIGSCVVNDSINNFVDNYIREHK